MHVLLESLSHWGTDLDQVPEVREICSKHLPAIRLLLNSLVFETRHQVVALRLQQVEQGSEGISLIFAEKIYDILTFLNSKGPGEGQPWKTICPRDLDGMATKSTFRDYDSTNRGHD